MGEKDRTALGDLLRRQFKERKFKCDIKTEDGIDPWLRFYLFPSDAHDPEKDEAVAQIYMDVSHALEPFAMPEKEPDKRDRVELGRIHRYLERGIKITSMGAGFHDDLKHYVLDVSFPAWQMEAARKIQVSFGKGIA